MKALTLIAKSYSCRWLVSAGVSGDGSQFDVAPDACQIIALYGRQQLLQSIPSSLVPSGHKPFCKQTSSAPDRVTVPTSVPYSRDGFKSRPFPISLSVRRAEESCSTLLSEQSCSDERDPGRSHRTSV